MKTTYKLEGSFTLQQLSGMLASYPIYKEWLFEDSYEKRLGYFRKLIVVPDEKDLLELYFQTVFFLYDNSTTPSQVYQSMGNIPKQYLPHVLISTIVSFYLKDANADENGYIDDRIKYYVVDMFDTLNNITKNNVVLRAIAKTLVKAVLEYDDYNVTPEYYNEARESDHPILELTAEDMLIIPEWDYNKMLNKIYDYAHGVISKPFLLFMEEDLKIKEWRY